MLPRAPCSPCCRLCSLWTEFSLGFPAWSSKLLEEFLRRKLKTLPSCINWYHGTGCYAGYDDYKKSKYSEAPINTKKVKHCSLILSCFFLNVFLTSRNESRIFQSFYLTEAVSPGGLVTNPVVFCMVPPILNNNFTGVVVFAERMRDELPMFHLNSRFRPPLISLCSGGYIV